MSDESDDKTEAPTPHRLEKAREEGQIPISANLRVEPSEECDASV
ncbi:EscU/YscU/HrcU family type III secretion system export apparatus switch protein, partial [Escherichia coli]|nr:EscU/YscU/HrcU family type III secretion system export apparatus switch protein [Escherichia coli]